MQGGTRQPWWTRYDVVGEGVSCKYVLPEQRPDVVEMRLIFFVR